MLDKRIEELCIQCLEDISMTEKGPRKPAEIEEISKAIEQNRAKIQHSWLEARLCMDKVDEAKKKIKIALLWTE